MRDDLHSSSAVVAATFLLKDGPVNLAGGDIGILVQTFINESFVMAQIQVSFRTVISYEYLAMLNGVHGSGVNINIRIKFLHRHLVASGFQKTAQGCGSNSFSKTGNNTACYKYIFYWHVNVLLLFIMNLLY